MRHSRLRTVVPSRFESNGEALPEASGGAPFAERWLAQRILASVGDPAIGIVLANGERVLPGGCTPRFLLHLHDRLALLRLLAYPELEFGELYSAGRIEVEGNLTAFLVTLYRSMERQDPLPLPARLHVAARRLRSDGGAARDRANIHHHYDLGNEFYASWLDPQAMQYTCAYYAQPTMTLAEAQQAKLHHVCRKLRLRPGEGVIEAGCGWGGLALFMARHYGVRVRAFNISHEQIEYARERAAAEGLAGCVEFVEEDWRNISGRCEAFVSVGMLEHVGPAHYEELGRVIDRCLSPDGRGLIHTIGRSRPRPLTAWIEKRIFPGAEPPSLAQMMALFEPQELTILDVENLRLHYARTCEQWLEGFERHREAIERMFDERFVRMWRLYLAGSAAAFLSGSLQLFQVVFARRRLNDLPWSRVELYRAELRSRRDGTL